MPNSVSPGSGDAGFCFRTAHGTDRSARMATTCDDESERAGLSGAGALQRVKEREQVCSHRGAEIGGVRAQAQRAFSGKTMEKITRLISSTIRRPGWTLAMSQMASRPAIQSSLSWIAEYAPRAAMTCAVLP